MSNMKTFERFLLTNKLDINKLEIKKLEDANRRIEIQLAALPPSPKVCKDCGYVAGRDDLLFCDTCEPPTDATDREESEK